VSVAEGADALDLDAAGAAGASPLGSFDLAKNSSADGVDKYSSAVRPRIFQSSVSQASSRRYWQLLDAHCACAVHDWPLALYSKIEIQIGAENLLQDPPLRRDKMRCFYSGKSMF